MRVGRIVESPACVDEGAAWLARIEPRFADLRAATGPWPLRRRADGFGALLTAILGQQVSTASAAALAARLQAAGLVEEADFAGVAAGDLRDLGLSRQKARYVVALSAARLDYAALRGLPDAQVQATLTALPGIGPWTAQIYAMFALGRADVFAPADLALQEAARRLFDLPERPGAKALATLAEAWSPWRAVAARGLWAYYRVTSGREGTL